MAPLASRKKKILLTFLDGGLSIQETCRLLNIHRTTLWRIRRKWRKEGHAAFTHGLQGRRSNRAKPEVFKRQLCDLYANIYRPLGWPVLSFYRQIARNLPEEVSYRTLLAWLRESGIILPKA